MKLGLGKLLFTYYKVDFGFDCINNHKTSRKLLAKIQTYFQNKKTDEKESMLS